MYCKPNDPITTICSETLGQTIYDGLSKREHFASMAMQGWISAIRTEAIGLGDMENVMHLAAKYSVGFADELIKQLNETP